jgi:hypothetical protein
VFVTEGTYNGNLGGSTGADVICQTQADAIGSLVTGKTFKAWLSDSNTYFGFLPTSRSFTRSSLPYERVDGVTIANGYDAFASSSHLAPINVTQYGTATQIGFVKTGVSLCTANLCMGIQDCSDWTSTEGEGMEGSTSSTSSLWNTNSEVSCELSAGLYCVEQ